MRAMTDPHPLVAQLRFTRSEFLRGVKGVSDADGRVRLGPMNCIAWNVGHLAWQEQRYFLTQAQERTPFPAIADTFAVGAPGTTPDLSETLAAWKAITAETDAWLDERCKRQVSACERPTRRLQRLVGVVALPHDMTGHAGNDSPDRRKCRANDQRGLTSA